MIKNNSSINYGAAVCSLFVPGLGQLLQGRFLLALALFILCIAGYVIAFLIIPGLLSMIFHLWGVVNAAKYKANT
jgi:TM2 domain-containing membrane protein YozV